MRSFPTRSVSLAFAVCAALIASVEACGGSTYGVTGLDGGPSPEGGGGEGGPVPLPEAGPDSGVLTPLTVFGAYAVRTVFLGETNRASVPTKDAWKTYGENIDGINSVKAMASGECKLLAGADSAKREDGIGGIDNSFGRTVLGFILGLVPTPSKTSNDLIETGGRTMMLNLLPAAGGRPASVGFLSASASSTPPVWNGTDVRGVSSGSVGSGPADALSISMTPAMNGSLVVSGVASGTFYLELPLQGVAWRIPIRNARMTMDVGTDGVRGTTGNLAGIAPTEELVAEIVKVAGQISTQLCGGSTLDTIKQTIRQASDILVDGTQDPSRDCNGISVGIGFEAVKVTVAGVQPDPAPAPDPCQP
jgi:hypothetical protein